jgi:hypothetical protein
VKYYLQLGDPNLRIELEESEIEPIKAFEEAGVQLFLHRSYKRDGWSVTERTTGVRVTEGSTKKEAIEKLHSIIKRRGITRFKKDVKQHLDYLNRMRAEA